ncbi:MAG: hypothetical protein ACREVL_10805 [Solimonas sp.]
MSLTKNLGAVLLAGMALSACGKKQEAAPADSAAPAATASAPAASDAAAQPVADEAALKKKAVDMALAEERIVSDARGQWATAATASSTYAYEKAATATVPYAPMQATGKPNVESYGDDGNSWASEKSDAGIEWLQVDFAQPVSATELRIRQNCEPGAIIKLELIDEQGGRHTVWEGVDEEKYPASTIAWFVRSFEATPYKAKGARITLASNAVHGWNEIDAVQLISQ